jgi:solute carrier family 25 S-adenosylmethionine transporter 26
MVTRESASASSATVQTLRKFKNNPLGLWRGYGALAGRNLPFTALQFPLFEYFKGFIKDSRARTMGDRTSRQMTLLEHASITAVAAGAAGSIAAVVTTPVDVVKTRIMLAAADGFANQDVEEMGKQAAASAKKGHVVDALGKLTGGNSPAKRMSSWAIGREIVQTHGWQGLMRGGALRAIWTTLGSGLYLGVYEGGRLYLERGRNPVNDDE